MVIIKISEKTVQCSIAAQELHEIGLTPEALLHGEEKSIPFMTQLNQEVGQQLSYDPENEVMMMSRNLMADGSVRIYAVKMDNDDIQSSADRLRSIAQGILDYLTQDKIDAVKAEKGKDKSDALNKLVEGMNNMVGRTYLEESKEGQELISALEKIQEVNVISKPALEYQRYMGEFDNLDKVIRFSKIASAMPIVDSALYKADDRYYLMMGLQTDSEAVVYELRKAGIEYASALSVNSPEELHLAETAECIIAKDAISHLAELEAES